jgi:uncharacterized membrane protein
MKNNSRIRFNPVTKEIEVAGTEKFVKTYFKKLQAMMSGSPAKTVAIKGKVVKKAKSAKVSPAKKKSGKKKVTNINKVVSLIQGSTEGISTAELKKKTGLVESQIWSIVNRTSKEGKIRKVKRGVYGAIVAS